MPTMFKNHNHVIDEAAVERDLEREAIFAPTGLSLSARNLLTDTQNGCRGRYFESDFLKIRIHFFKKSLKQNQWQFH